MVLMDSLEELSDSNGLIVPQSAAGRGPGKTYRGDGKKLKKHSATEREKRLGSSVAAPLPAW